MNATVLDLRKNMKSVLAAIERNEHVTLTHRGRKKAVIVPYREQKEEQSVSQHPALECGRTVTTWPMLTPMSENCAGGDSSDALRHGCRDMGAARQRKGCEGD